MTIDQRIENIVRRYVKGSLQEVEAIKMKKHLVSVFG